MAALTGAQRIQLILDWHYNMKARGKPVANRFRTDLQASCYHQLHTKKTPLTPRQLAAQDKTIRDWHIDTWAAEHYPALKGVAPPPPPPPAPTEEEDVGFAFQSDDELDM
jgi:hypothetical protein